MTVEGLTGMGWVMRKETDRGAADGRRGPSFHRMLRPSADGRAVVDGLPAGEYEARSNPDLVATFRVPGAGVVRLERQAPAEQPGKE